MSDAEVWQAVKEVVLAVTMLVTAVTALIVAIRQHSDVKVNRTILKKVATIEDVLSPNGNSRPNGDKPPAQRPDGSASNSGGKPD